MFFSNISHNSLLSSLKDVTYFEGFSFLGNAEIYMIGLGENIFIYRNENIYENIYVWTDGVKRRKSFGIGKFPNSTVTP